MLVYLSFIVIVAYLCATYFMSGKDVPESISSTYFVIKKKRLFSLVMIISSLLLALPFYQLTPLGLLFLPFLGIIGMLMVGIFPNTEDPKQLKYHMIGGVGGCVCFNIWTSIMGSWYIAITWGLLIIGATWLCKTDKENVRNRILLHIKEHIIFWVEVITLLGVYGTMLSINTHLF